MKKWLKTLLIVILVLAVAAGVFMRVTMDRLNLTKVEDYLYTADCGHMSIGLANRLLSFVDADVDASCASVRKDCLLARNFDWNYNEEAEFVVRCGGHGEKYASIGVASVTGIENERAEKERYMPIYHALQLFTVDGINEAGLVVNTNIVPKWDVEATVGTNPGGMRLCSVLIPRYLLDNAGSVEESVELLRAADIYSYLDEGEPFELHFMISDPEETVVIEFIDNEMHVVYGEPIMTNFFMALDEYTEHAMGIERYDILKNGYDEVSDEASMLELLKSVWYSQLYTKTDVPWYSEDYGTIFNEKGEMFGMSSDPEDFRDALNEEKRLYDERTRNGDTWQTTHTSLYNMEDCSLCVVAQENGQLFRFSLFA